MTKLTLQEQMLKAGLVSSKKMAKVQRTAKKSRVQAREAREAVEVNKQAQIERDKELSEQQKQATLAKEYNGRLAIARLVAEAGRESEYAIIPAVVANKIMQRDASYIVLSSELTQEAKDEDDPYADFVVPDDLMW